jgi:hypothetical protein
MASGAFVYIVKVRSHLAASWLASFPVISLVPGFDGSHRPMTTMTLEVIDQSELMGFLTELHGMGLQLLLVRDQNMPALEPNGAQPSLQRGVAFGEPQAPRE